ncbi:MAG: hypothetical protein OJF47_002749 [Nitrospira sp.]|nr:MAG: hypothetical protein OJF47_002749 [Nitrospira sp.]
MRSAPGAGHTNSLLPQAIPENKVKGLQPDAWKSRACMVRYLTVFRMNKCDNF